MQILNQFGKIEISPLRMGLNYIMI